VMAVPPRTGVFGLIGEYNLRLARYAAFTGLPYLDQWSVLVNPLTEQYVSAYDSGDGIHPSSSGCKAVAARAVLDLCSAIPAGPDIVGLASAGWNLAPGYGHAVDSNADGISEGYTATVGSGFSCSRVADSGGAGWYWQRTTLASAGTTKTVTGPLITFGTGNTTLSASAAPGALSITTVANPGTGAHRLAGANGSYEMVRVLSVAGTGPYTCTLSTLTPLRMTHSVGHSLTPAVVAGDTLAFALRVRSAQAASRFVPQFTFYTAGQASATGNVILSSPNSVNGFRSLVDDSVLYAEAVVPASTAIVQFSFDVGAQDGTYDFALPVIGNLTQVGG
jgi:hypothetical protein